MGSSLLLLETSHRPFGAEKANLSALCYRLVLNYRHGAMRSPWCWGQAYGRCPYSLSPRLVSDLQTRKKCSRPGSLYELRLYNIRYEEASTPLKPVREYRCGYSVPYFINQLSDSGRVFIGQTQTSTGSEHSGNVDKRTMWIFNGKMLFLETCPSFVAFQTKHFQSVN